MQPLVSTIKIARSPRDVFAFVTDPARFPEWQADVVGVRMLDDARFVTTRRIRGAERTITQTDRPQRSTARLGRSGSTAHPSTRYRHGRARDGGACRG